MPATLSSLTADVVTITKRPDLVLDIALHVKNALLKAHGADFWAKDLFETNFTFGAPDVNYSLVPTTIIPRFKKIKYMTVVSPVNGDVVRKLTSVAIDKFVDEYNYIQDNVFYLAGDTIKIRVSDSSKNFGIGCYLYPDTTLVIPSWIADEIPFAILYEAARTLFKIIGKDSESASMERLVSEAMAEVRLIGLTTTSTE